MSPLAHHDVTVAIRVDGIVAGEGARTGYPSHHIILLANLHLSERAHIAVDERQHGGVAEARVREGRIGVAGNAYGIKVIAKLHHTCNDGGFLAVEEVLDGHFREVEVALPDKIALECSYGADRIRAKAHGVLIQRPRTDEFGMQPSAAVHVILDDALIHMAMQHSVVKTGVFSQVTTVDVVVAISHINVPLGSSLLIRLHLVGRCVACRSQKIHFLQQILLAAGLRFCLSHHWHSRQACQRQRRNVVCIHRLRDYRIGRSTTLFR